ncbi:MAG: formate dehydrogenase accessory sulfurtransferase FdhD [Candidatus Bathyarchaeota archaeon]
MRRLSLNGTIEQLDDVVAEDAPICIFINDDPFRTLIASPNMLEELALGHLFTEGVITSIDDVETLQLKPLRVDINLRYEINIDEILWGRSRLITTACGLDQVPEKEIVKLRVTRAEEIDPLLVSRLIKSLNEKSRTFRETGGTHSALLYSTEKGEVAFSEDVGRHNALDKVIGTALKTRIDFSKCIIASSGRLSGEMVLKAARAGIPILCSVSAPLLSGLRLADVTGVTLVGFVRGQRMNQYLHS